MLHFAHKIEIMGKIIIIIFFVYVGETHTILSKILLAEQRTSWYFSNFLSWRAEVLDIFH